MANNAVLLDALESRTDDVARLLEMTFNKATNWGALLRSDQVGVLGRDRDFEWNITDVRDENGDVTVSLGGAEQRFVLQSDGSYKGEETATLSEAGGAFELELQGGTQIAFNLDGRFDTIRDANGNEVRATYDGSRLSQVTASDGDTLAFSYNPQGRLVQVTDQDGRTKALGYDQSGEYLISVTTPDGTTTFEYIVEEGPSQHALFRITLPDGTTRTFDYDAQGRLVGESLNDGAQGTTYAYRGTNSIAVTDATGAKTLFFPQ